MKFLTAIISGIHRFIQTLISMIHMPRTRIPMPGNFAARLTLKSVLIGLSVLAIAASVMSIVKPMIPEKIEYNRVPYLGLGQALAEETKKALNGYGSVVVLITKSNKDKGTPAHDQLKGFQNEISKYNGITIVEVLELNEDGLDTGYWLDQFERVLKRYGKINVIVSLIGLPAFDPQHPPKMPDSPPKIIAVNQSFNTTQDYFKYSLATVLLSPRTKHSLDSNSTPKTPREWVESQYEVLTAKSFDTAAK